MVFRQDEGTSSYTYAAEQKTAPRKAKVNPRLLHSLSQSLLLAHPRAHWTSQSQGSALGSALPFTSWQLMMSSA
jgi:hypothetical protein